MAAARSEGTVFQCPLGLRQLFLDDFIIERTENLRRVLNQPVKHSDNPVLCREHPWEGRRVQVYGTALYDPDERLFKMWYLSIPRAARETVRVNGQERPGHATLLAYATSKDGVHWEKPSLGLVDFEGSTENNLLMPEGYNVEGASILYEPSGPDPSRRYKAWYWDHGRGPLVLHEGVLIYGEDERTGMYVAFSGDGLHWTPYEGNPVIKTYSDTGQCVLWDPELQRYVAYGRLGFGRRVARTESPDFIHWSEPQLVLEPDAQDGGCQFYGIAVDLYQRLYVGLLWIMHPEVERLATLDVQLVTSRDGIHWERAANREVFLPNGPSGAFDAADIRTACHAVVLDDRILIYYAGASGKHGSGSSMEIGLATLRLDGYASLNGGAAGGAVLTKAFRCPGGRLYLNADAARGEVGVTVCDAERKPLPGFQQSLPIREDSLSAAVSFASGAEIQALAGQPIRLLVRVRSAKLYSFCFR